MTYITRGTQSWQFRYTINAETVITKTFSDHKCQGKAKALTAAKNYRDAVLGALRKKVSPVRLRHKGNQSGVIGVRLQIKEGMHGVYESWVGYGMHDGKSWHRSFSTDLHGEIPAFQQACTERYRRHGELSILCPMKKLPCIPSVPYNMMETQ